MSLQGKLLLSPPFQKLKMFLPDTSEKLHFVNISIDYEIFKQKHRIFDLTSKRKELSKLSILPQFTFIILVDNFSNIETIKLTLKSIANQIYENYDLQILNCSKNIINLDDFKNEIDLNRIQLINKKTEHVKLNEIISQVKGQFIAFLDSSIILQNNLLYQIVMELNKNPNSDIFYTDEDSRDVNNNRVKPFFKPDFSPYLLSSLNYIGRFCVIKKTILDQIGEFEFKIHHNLSIIYFLDVLK